MPDNRLTLTIEAQNTAQAAFKQLQADVRQTNDALKRTDQTARQSSGGIKVIRDELGRFHDAATGRYVSASRALREGFTEMGQAATRAVAPVRQLRTQAAGLEQLHRAGQEIADAFIRMPGPIGRTTQAIQRAGGSVARLTDQFVGLYRSSGAVRQLGRDFRFLQNNIQATSGVVQQFTRNLTAQTGAIITQAARVERLKLGLETLSPSIQAAEAQYQGLIEVARLPGIDFSNALQASLQLQAIGESGEEATRTLKAFGNALALGGASTADIQRVIYGLRQLIADGVVLQRELNLITARVPVSIPILRQQFGGVRAEDIREHFDSIGVARSDQASEFIKILTAELEKLPSASETAANAIENLGDTFRRAQAATGEGLLPVVKETIATLEDLLFTVEKDEGLKTAIADWLAFATAMGTVTAGVVGVAAVIPLLGGLANPIGVTALAAGALAGAFVKAEVAAARLRAEYQRTQDALKVGLLTGQGENTEAIEKQISRLEARRERLQEQIRSEENRTQDALRPTLGGSRLFEENVQQTLAANEAYKTYQDQLFQVDKAIEVLTRRTDKLSESQQDAADTAENSLARAFKSLGDAAAGTDAQIATALQQFENASGSANEAVRDLALDIGNELVAIAESTTESQIRSAYKRVESYARDNSLIIAEDENLKALLLAAENAFQQRLSDVIEQARRKRLATDRDRLIRDSASGIRDALAVLDNRDANAGQLQDAQQELNAFADVLNRLGGVVPNLEAFNDQFRILIQLRSHDEDIGQRLQAIGREISSAQSALQKEAQIRRNLSAQSADDAEEAADRQIAAVERVASQSEAAADRVESRNAARRQAETRANEAATRERTRALEVAIQDLARLEERALDADSQRQRENLIRETAQYVDAYAERGQAYRDLVQDAQDLGADLQAAFDLTEQMRRVDELREGVAGLLSDLAGVAIDHFWQLFTDGAQTASDSIQNFVQEGQDAIRLLESDILRITRFDEDSTRRQTRLEEDKERRLAQLQRQRQALLARTPVGDQAAQERHIQRVQDLTHRISQTRADFDVRISRFDEDTETRRSRLLEDATSRRERFESRQTDASLLSKLVDSLASSVSSAISSALGGAVAGLITSALSGHFTALIDAIKGLFSSGGDGGTQSNTGTQTATPSTQEADTTTPALEGDADVDGTIKTLTVDPNITTPNIDVAGTIKSAVQATDGYTAASVDVVGSLKSAVVDAAYSPITVEVRGLIASVMLAPDLVFPVVNLKGVVNQLSVDPAAEIPTVSPNATLKQFATDPAAVIPTVDTGAMIKSLMVDASVPSPQVDADATIKSLVVSADSEAPDITTTGRITSLVTDPAVVVPDVDIAGRITELNNSFTEPIPVQARADVELNLPDTDLLPPIDLGGLRITNAPNVPITFTADTTGLVEVIQQAIKDALGGGDEDTGAQAESTDDSGRIPFSPNEETGDNGTENTGTTTAATVANEGRRDKVFGSDTTEQTSITPEDLTRSLRQGAEEGVRSGLHDLPRTIAEAMQGVVSAVLSSGVAVGGDGVSLGSSSAADQLNRDVANTFQPDGSFRTDQGPPTLMGRDPAVHGGNADPDDDEVAQAPAAVRQGSLLTAAALEGLATESTLASVSASAAQIAANTGLLADLPLITSLAGQGVSVEDARNNLNLGERQTDLLTILQSAQSLAGPTPDLSQIAGSSESNPMYMHMVNQREVQDVRLVGGKIESVGSVGEITKQVEVNQVGVVQVAQSGEWVMRLASGATIPVYVQGGSVQANISQSDISALAESIDVENQRRDAFNTAI